MHPYHEHVLVVRAVEDHDLPLPGVSGARTGSRGQAPPCRLFETATPRCALWDSCRRKGALLRRPSRPRPAPATPRAGIVAVGIEQVLQRLHASHSALRSPASPARATRVCPYRLGSILSAGPSARFDRELSPIVHMISLCRGHGRFGERARLRVQLLVHDVHALRLPRRAMVRERSSPAGRLPSRTSRRCCRSRRQRSGSTR